MLNFLRGSGQSKAMWIIMGLLMVGLMGFGAAGLGGGTVRSIGTVGEEPIEINSYVRAYQSASAQVSQQLGRRATPEELQLFGIQDRVLDTVVQQTALGNETVNIGLSVGDDLVRQSILDDPRFQGLDGKFDSDAYEFYIDRQLNISAAEYETLLRKENARALLQNSIVGGISTGNAIPMTVLKFSQQQRSFEWAALTADQLETPTPPPSDEDLQAYYDSNSDDYMSPLTRNITYVWMNPADLLDQVDVAETEIRESYDLQADRFNKPEQRAVDRIVFPTNEDAQAARERLDAETASFSDIVAERGLNESDVDLGEIEANALSKEAAEVVFSQTEPGVVGPIESSLGPALFRINAILAADNTPFEEARGELRDELAGEAARRLVADTVGDIDDLLAGGAELEELAEKTDMKLGQIGYFAGSEDPVAAYDEFREAAEQAKEEDFPEVFELSDGGVMAIRLDSIDQPAPIPFADVRDKLVAHWTAAEEKKRLLELAETLEPKLEEGGDLTGIGLELTAVDGITRGSYIEALPQAVLQKVYELELNKGAVVEAAGQVFLVRLTNITEFDPDLEGNDELLNQIKSQVDSQLAVDVLEFYTNALEAKAGVTLNRAVINQLNTQVSGY